MRLYRQRFVRGFTIVELLIVIVIIAILAAITIVSFNGIQARARDSQRLADARNIMKLLEVYKTTNGQYPTHSPVTVSATCATHNNGYSYSDATDGRWLPVLITSSTVNKVPVAPGNNCTSYYRYLYVSATGYGCTTRTSNYYILQIVGIEGTAAPSDAVSGTFTPCVGATASWGTSSTVWTFEKDDV